MGFNSAFKGLQLLKKTGNGRLNNLNDPVLNVLRRNTSLWITWIWFWVTATLGPCKYVLTCIWPLRWIRFATV